MADHESELAPLLEALREVMETKGLYAMGQHVISSAEDSDVENATSLAALIDDGSEFIVTMAFHLGRVAWTDRILRPEAHDAEIQFQIAMPTEDEIELERIRREAPGFLGFGDDTNTSNKQEEED